MTTWFSQLFKKGEQAHLKPSQRVEKPPDTINTPQDDEGVEREISPESYPLGLEGTESPFWAVLDKGFIRCEEIFGDETVIVNAARVSFGKRKTVLDDQDDRLIGYLLRNRHYSPFRHVMFRFHIKAPEFVMRQWFKHVVGCEWTSTIPSQLHGWNEISGRYVEMMEWYVPSMWRRQSQNSKQGSQGELDDNDQTICDDLYKESIDKSFQTYHQLLEMGVAKEQARIVLPLTVYTETIWTASLQALTHFIQLRDEEHAQMEIREYAHVLSEMLKEKFPCVYKHVMSIHASTKFD